MDHNSLPSAGKAARLSVLGLGFFSRSDRAPDNRPQSAESSFTRVENCRWCDRVAALVAFFY